MSRSMSSGDKKPRIRWSYKRSTWQASIERLTNRYRISYLFLMRCPICKRQDWRGTSAKACRECSAQYSLYLNSVRAPALRAVQKAIRSGQLPKLNPVSGVRDIAGIYCADCGKPAQVYDHRDYSKPLDVVPVCTVCNSRRGHASDLAPLIMARPEWRGLN